MKEPPWNTILNQIMDTSTLLAEETRPPPGLVVANIGEGLFQRFNELYPTQVRGSEQQLNGSSSTAPRDDETWETWK